MLSGPAVGERQPGVPHDAPDLIDNGAGGPGGLCGGLQARNDALRLVGLLVRPLPYT